MSRYLLQGKTGQVYPYTEQLAARKDMQECDKDGQLIEPPVVAPEVPTIEGVSPEALAQAVNEAVANTVAGVVELAKVRFNLDIEPTMPLPQMIDLILVAHEEQLESKPEIDKMTKAQLLTYAKETYNVDLDPELKVDAMRAAIRKLADPAGQ